MKNKIYILTAFLMTLTFNGMVHAHGLVHSTKNMPIKEFITQNFWEGLPYNEVRQYPASEVEKLLDMLNNPSYVEHWQKIIVMLEMIGEESDFKHIIDFIENDNYGEFGELHYQAKKSAIFGLGYMVKHTGSTDALQYLIDSVNPDVWYTRKITNISSGIDNYTERNYELSRYALLGLSLAGTKESEQALKKFVAQKNRYPEFFSKVEHMIDGLMIEHNKIKSKGMVTYHRDGAEVKADATAVVRESVK